jgi:translation elongation factor EF-G
VLGYSPVTFAMISWATFTMQFDHYEDVPQSIATELISAAGS